MSMHRMRFAVPCRLLAVGLVVMTVAGCAKGTRDLEEQLAEIRSRQGAPVEPLPAMRDFPPFPYTAFDLRDPFAPFSDDQNAPSGGGTGVGPDPDRSKEYLESYPLDSLDMVGTLGTINDLTALIKDPDGVVHRLSPGNYVGQNDGQITGVFEDRIEVVELVSNGNGGWIERPASIALDDE
jgi:type IV pilus assembly protein PilP